MKKFFFTGFITLLPLALTFWIARWLFDLFTAPFAGIIESLIISFEKTQGLVVDKHHTLVTFLSRTSALVLLLILIFVLGFCGRRYFIRFFLKMTDRLFSRIPIIRTIYRLSHDVTKALFSENKKTFKETVLVPFPHHEALAIGFVTGNTPSILNFPSAPTDLVVFVPTAPHPMSGFVLLCPKKNALSVDVSVEDAFKFLISCGVLDPGAKKP